MTDQALQELIRWFVAAGADEAIGDVPINRLDRPDPVRAAPLRVAVPAPRAP